MSSLYNAGRWLASARLFWVLVGLNLLITIAVAVIGLHSVTPDDRASWIGLADSLQHGRYSSLYFLPNYIPDTFRNPGYPVFLALLKVLGASEHYILLVQFGLYLATIALVTRLAASYESPNSWLVRNFFLLLLLPNIQLAYLAAYIYPEVLTGFLVAAYGILALTWPRGTWRRTLGLALLAGLVFQVRPTFVFFPLVQIWLDYRQTQIKAKFSWVQAIALLGLFGATMLPYTFWNYRHHGILKPTSLEGGAGVMQIGFWALRMPAYQEHRYWGNTMGDEIISFADDTSVPSHIAAFNQEWDSIDAQCQPLLTASDRHMLRFLHDSLTIAQPNYAGLGPTYSSAYTLRREHLLMQANLADIRREPGYYLKTRLYTLVRLWVTGVQRPAWRAATTPLAKAKVLYPTVVSGITFLLAILCLGWVLLYRRQVLASPTWQQGLALVMYFGLVHLPFAIQARYTVPVRPWLLLCIAVAVAAWLTRRMPAAGSAID